MSINLLPEMNLSPEITSKFESIVERHPKLDEAEILFLLSQEPQSDRKTFYRWRFSRHVAQIYDEIAGDPTPITTTIDIIKNTNFQQSESLDELYGYLSTLKQFEPLPLGVYTVDDNKYYCTVELQPCVLPIDFQSKDLNPSPTILHLKGSSVALQGLFPFFFAIGRLYCRLSAKTTKDICSKATQGPNGHASSEETSQEEAQDTSFAVVVDPHRNAWAIFSPFTLGEDPYPPDSDSDSEFGDLELLFPRSASGTLPGFKDACTVVDLGLIDNLLADAASSVSKTLTISPENFVVLEKTKFGDLDAESWKLLRELVPGWGSLDKCQVKIECRES